MLDLSSAIAAQVAGSKVRYNFLVYFDFLSGPRRVWNDIYPLTSGGHAWDGVGPAFVTLDPGTPSADGSAEPFSVGLSGVDPTFLARVRASESDAIGRAIAIYLQFFDEDWQPLDSPVQLRRGRMTGFSFSGAGDQPRSVTCRAEGSLVARGRATNLYLSSVEQRTRFPGDGGCDYIPNMREATVVWPK
ncbi:hypothetical protein [Ancylobacter radicis]|uniref:Uncharacterized protein n=1 Tax=Ancylobacter radicis TaxID=2836179 RepID=A0ABS5R3M3_9HYPH|nr:hypothetical protein [Ancylobacter radicis]MBS9476244.1 hypothetical protein [Ancylobacter radicis]